MDESYTCYEIATYSRIQQNNYFDPAAMEEIKKTTKEIQLSLEEMTQHTTINSFARVQEGIGFIYGRKNKGITVENFSNRKS